MPKIHASLVNTFFAIALAALVVYILIIGQKILVPFVIALLMAYFIAAISDGIANIRVLGVAVLKPFSLVAAVLIVFGAFYLLGNVIIENANLVAANAAAYQQNLDLRLKEIGVLLGTENIPTFTELLQSLASLDIGTIMNAIVSPLTALAGNAVAILIYTAFIVWERRTLPLKIAALAKNPKQQQRIERTLIVIGERIRRYLAIKTMSSTLVATISYVIMRIIGIDFAVFWAVLTFLLNFIPYIGSIVAVAFPITLTLVQPGIEDPLPTFVASLISLTAAQQMVGSFIEPRWMGTTLNLSPLFILLSLAIWGSIWGVVGMLISIPIMVIALIIFSQFEPTRPIAVVLSQSGNVEPVHDEILYLEAEIEEE